MVDVFTQLIIDIAIIAVSFIALNYASNIAINNAVKVSTITRLGKTAVGFSLIAFSTSLPELTVALIAAFSGGAALSVGNVLGSNIVNICVIIGLASFLVYYQSRRRAKRSTQPMVTDSNVVPNFAKSELSNIYFGLFISSLIPIVLIFISAATWLIGLVLIGIFVGYMYQLSKVRLPQENGEEATAQQEKHKLKKFAALTILGALGVVVSAYFLVESAVNIAEAAGLSQQVIGATVIAIGTSLPELTIDLKAFLKGHPGLAFGDIIGSSFVNITLILGVTFFVPALVGSPVSMRMDVFQNLVLFSIITNLIFWYFLSRGQIGRREGAVFLFIYALFIITILGVM